MALGVLADLEEVMPTSDDLAPSYKREGAVDNNNDDKENTTKVTDNVNTATNGDNDNIKNKTTTSDNKNNISVDKNKENTKDNFENSEQVAKNAQKNSSTGKAVHILSRPSALRLIVFVIF